MADSDDPRRRLPPVKCLLVDDLPENLLVLSAVLQSDGLELLTATSGTQALELLLEHDVALALLDVQMPGMDGFQLAELMRGSERTCRIPIIFVTAGAHDERHQFKGYDTGAVDFLYKPINPAIIRNKAEVFFQLHRQRQQIALELQERTRALHLNELFTAVLGHDLRDPLNAILLSAQLLQRRPDPEAVPDIADRILHSGRRMQRMISDLLDLARGRLGQGISVRREPADLGVLVGRAVEELERPDGDRPIEVAVGGDLHGEWDHTRMAQVVSNLVGNALLHGHAGSTVQVALDGSAPDEVCLAVSNPGEIPSALQREIFEPFRRGASPARNPQGLGLGLYIVREIVHAHGGHVQLDCGTPGWTSFRVRVPRRAEGDPTPQAA